jgi:hypothetical protein
MRASKRRPSTSGGSVRTRATGEVDRGDALVDGVGAAGRCVAPIGDQRRHLEHREVADDLPR